MNHVNIFSWNVNLLCVFGPCDLSGLESCLSNIMI